jgi:SAM-dependent methyltransferase
LWPPSATIGAITGPMASEDSGEYARIWDGDEHAMLFADEALASLQALVDLHEPGWKRRRVLDFGCGTGLLTARLAPLVAEVVAVDISSAMLDVLAGKSIPNVVTHRGDLLDPTYRATASWLSGFDLVVTSCVCDALVDYPAALRILASALKPGGVLAQWDWIASDDDDDGLRIDVVERALAAADLTCLHLGEAFHIDFEDDDVPVLMAVGMRRLPLLG